MHLRSEQHRVPRLSSRGLDGGHHDAPLLLRATSSDSALFHARDDFCRAYTGTGRAGSTPAIRHGGCCAGALSEGQVVWLNTASGIYHEKGMRWYGKTKHGAYVCQREADAAGDRDTRNGQ
jgi:hypothetical protein